MKRLLGGTLVLALASLASAAPQTPTTGKNQPVQTVQKHPAKKRTVKRSDDKEHAQTGDNHNKNNKSQTNSGKPVK